MRDAVRPRVALLVLLLAGAAVQGTVAAGDSRWILIVQPTNVAVHGQEQHVLNVHRIQLGPPQDDAQAAVSLETEDVFTGRIGIRNLRGAWGWGFEFYQVLTSQVAPTSSEAPGGEIDRVVFEVADQSFVSDDPADLLFFRIREDTDLELWTADVYGLRRLAGDDRGNLELQFGLRIGDFDNDYRAVVGIDGVSGSQLDASSNYGAMVGPYVALSGRMGLGRNTLEGYLGQSVILGESELSGSSHAFTGDFAGPTFGDRESIHQFRDVAIPITELRLGWTYRLTRRVGLGLGVGAMVWSDVPVPPGIAPQPGGDGVFHENTLVVLGTAARVEVTF